MQMPPARGSRAASNAWRAAARAASPARRNESAKQLRHDERGVLRGAATGDDDRPTGRCRAQHGISQPRHVISPSCIVPSMSAQIEYKSSRNVVYSCKYHIVWCPKYRRQVLVHGVEKRLKKILEEVAAEAHAEVIELEVMPDHVHLLVEVHPQLGIHRLIKAMKGRSSRLLRHEFPQLKSRLPTLWTNSYFVSTVGGAPLAVIKQYIENQKHV